MGGSKINALRPLPHSTIAQDGQNYKMRTELKGHQQPTGSETKLKNCKKCVHGDNVIKKREKSHTSNKHFGMTTYRERATLSCQGCRLGGGGRGGGGVGGIHRAHEK